MAATLVQSLTTKLTGSRSWVDWPEVTNKPPSVAQGLYTMLIASFSYLNHP